MSTQNIQTTLDIVAAAATTQHFTSLMPGTFRKVVIINNGVNDDKTTNYNLDVMLYKGTFTVFSPSYRLTVGDSQEIMITDDIKIAYQVGTINGTVLFIEMQPTPLGKYAPGDPTAFPKWAKTWSSYRENVKAGTIVQPTTANTYQYYANDAGETGDTEPSWPVVVGNTVVDTFTNWSASTAYTVGEKVTPTVANTFQYECITAGTSGLVEPTWDTNSMPETWSARKSYEVDDVVVPSTLASHQYKCIVSGRSASVEPTFGTNIGLPTIDRPPVWTTATSVTAGTYVVPTDGLNVVLDPTFTIPAPTAWFPMPPGWTDSGGFASYNGITDNAKLYMEFSSPTPNSGYFRIKFKLLNTLSTAALDITIGSSSSTVVYSLRNGVDGDYDTCIYDPDMDLISYATIIGKASGGSFDIDNFYVYPLTGYMYKAVTSGTTGNIEPTWATTTGMSTLDGSVKWEVFPLDYTMWVAEALTGYTTDTTPIWQASTGYLLNDVVTAVVADGVTQYRCTNPGASGAVEPAWDTTIGNPTADNTVVWTAEAASVLTWGTEPLNTITWECEALGTYHSDYTI